MPRKYPFRLLPFAVAFPVIGMMLGASVAAPAVPPLKKPATGALASPPSFDRDALPVVQKYCVACHGGDSPSGGVLLTGDRTEAAMLAHRDVWDRVAANVDSRHMPPTGSPAPTPAERGRLVNYVQSTLSRADCVLKDPGRVTVRRLNRVEYDNTIRDLTGLDLHLSDDFPSDDVGYGFDNIGDVLSISPLLMEKYLTAAGKIARAAIASPEDAIALDAKTKHDRHIIGSQLTGDGKPYPSTDSEVLRGTGEMAFDYDFPMPGRYRFRVDAWETHAGSDNVQMAIRFDGQTMQTVTVEARQPQPGAYDASIEAPTMGRHRLSVAFLNPYEQPDDPDPKKHTVRRLVVDGFRVAFLSQTAAAVAAQAVAQRRILVTVPTDRSSDKAFYAAAHNDLSAFAFRAYRRPATPAEIDRLMHIVTLVRGQGGSFERAMQFAVQATLISPNFLFRIEKDPAPNERTVRHPISDYELATRLSYFLWSTMPDSRLFHLAAAGKLHNPTVLEAEAQRMLHDPRAHALADNFAAQWLQLRKLVNATPDTVRFPEWNDDLRSAMRTETLTYFQSIVDGDRSVLEFLDSNYTYLNEPLARLYGNTEVKGNEFRRVTLQSNQRGGVLTQASILTVTSNPTRTSPVKRGRWVLENILGINIPAPPPGVPVLADDKQGPITGTLRQRMEKHRTNPACASCHQQMDPIGFGLENYDAVGKWRTIDDGAIIDASGTLPGGGAAFTDPAQLRAALKARGPQFVHNLSEKLLTYALGRGIENYDRCNVDIIAKDVAQHGYKFSSLIDAIVTSEPFRNRRGDNGTGKQVQVGER